MSRVLLIEDAIDIGRIVKAILPSHELVHVNSLQAAREVTKDQSFDLILLDVLLPDGDGFQFCAELQGQETTRNAPLIFLTGKTSTSEKVLGFALGAEDYITKPFDPLEVRARIEAKLNKAKKSQDQSEHFSKGDLNFELALQKASLKQGETLYELPLTAFEFKLLIYLARHEDHVLSREQLLQEVWGDQVHVLDRTIDSHMSNLRKKIKGSCYTISSVYGAGYRFTQKQKQNHAA